jgi:hypothetical protein
MHVRIAIALVWLLSALASTAVRADDFERTVAPILIKRCLTCHSGPEAAGKLSLASAAGIAEGGESGPPVVAGKPGESLLFRRIRDGEMPPPKQGRSQALPAGEIAQLKQWIERGAAWPAGRVLDLYEMTTDQRGGLDWWSLQPVRRPKVPPAKTAHAVANPIDAFVCGELNSRGWSLAPAADTRTLVRRVYYDLIGLPPTFDEVEAFARDESPAAYSALIERLLASPHYGERWGRYWLDVVRYAETCGYERDQVKPNVWKYRDWVIAAFNRDLPFDRFVLEQLAGDELPDRTDPALTEQSLIATGFLRLGTWNDEPNDAEEYKYDRLEDLVGATSAAFLGLTVKCARCHDHKFDPIRQEDYYRLGSAFWAGYIEPGPRDLLGGPDAAKLGHDVLGWTDRSVSPPPLRLLKKGDPKRPGPIVQPAHLSFLPALDKAFAPPAPGVATTHRRLQFAQWIVDPRNPLTPRVCVNRLWHYHFGKGLVRSPDNFGFTGEKPTHPELLDWLADELVRSGWSTRHIHRLILLSHVYRQSSLHPRQEEYARSDFGNRLWWHAERRRLDAEALRDSLLAVGGNLDLSKFGGPSFAPVISGDALEGLSMKGNAWKASPPEEQGRRSVYIFTKRGLLPPLATTFDFPDTTLPCGQRDVTTVAPQALALLNNDFLHQQSQSLARRVLAATGDDCSRIVRAWQLALGRRPSDSEMSAAAFHLNLQRRHFQAAKQSPAAVELLAWASLCHVLLNTNEFMYVD